MPKKSKLKVNHLTDLASRAALLKNEFIAAGLYKTYHAMDGVTKAIGWEIAEIIEGKHVTKLESVMLFAPKDGMK